MDIFNENVRSLRDTTKQCVDIGSDVTLLYVRGSERINEKVFPEILDTVGSYVLI